MHEKVEPERKNLLQIKNLDRIGNSAVASIYNPDSRVPTLTNASNCSSGAIKNEFRDIKVDPPHPGRLDAAKYVEPRKRCQASSSIQAFVAAGFSPASGGLTVKSQPRTTADSPQ
jgi:hypothetical protein